MGARGWTDSRGGGRKAGGVLWAIAVVIVLGAAAWQRVSDTTRPIQGEVLVSGQTVSYSLLGVGSSGEPIRVSVPAPEEVSGNLRWRAADGEGAFQSSTMLRDGEQVVGFLPAQPPGTELEYSLVLAGPSGLTRIPTDGTVPLQIRGSVPGALLFPHVGILILSRVVGVRAGLGAVWALPGAAGLSKLTVAGLTVGGMILGPIVLNLAAGSYWTGWPLGSDWRANSLAVMWLVWVVAALAAHGASEDATDRFARTTVIGAALVTVLVSLVPRGLYSL
jgi:hypothetical protein